jgi:hypothetical protein
MLAGKLLSVIVEEHFRRLESQFNMWDLYNEAVPHQFIDFKKVCDSVRRKVLYIIGIEYGMQMKQVWLVEMCFTETYSKVWM